MGIDHRLVDPVAGGQHLQLTRDSPGRDPLSMLIKKKEAAFLAFFFQPVSGLRAE